MNAWDMFEALSEIDATEFDCEAKKSNKTALRFILLAASIALLIGSVLAVGLGARVHFDEQTVELHGVSLVDNDGESTNSVTYHSAHVSLDMSTVRIRATEELSRDLTAQWKADPSLKTATCQTAQGARRNFGTVAEAEAFLGIELLNSPTLERLVRGVFVTMVISDSERVNEQYASENRITPDGLIVYLSLRRDENSALDSTLVSESGITVYIALTQAFLESESERHLYSHEAEGRFRESGLLISGGKSLLLLENTPEEGFCQSGYAAWCNAGLGYLAHIKTYPDSYATPLSLLTPILYDIK